MKCPKCSRENPDDARTCTACGTALPLGPDETDRLDVRTSRLSIASCIFGLSCGALAALITAAYLRTSYVVEMLAFACLISGILAVVLGIAALACIAKNGGRLIGRGLAAVGITIPVCLFFLSALMVRVRGGISYRLYCGTNLSGIGKAMLLYANDYDDELPLAGVPGSKLGQTANWKADTRAEAFSDGQASISANFYLLIKYAEATPKSFLCKGDPKVTEFIPAKYKVRNKDLVDLWDFGPDPSKHCSYTYHFPYGSYALTTDSHPRMAIAADRNPWLNTPGHRARPASDFKSFDPDGPRESVRLGNALTHKQDGQNVLFMDGHTSFEKTPACGVNDDNIYTPWNGNDIRKGARPTLKSRPASKTDSLLLHDPPKRAAK